MSFTYSTPFSALAAVYLSRRSNADRQCSCPSKKIRLWPPLQIRLNWRGISERIRAGECMYACTATNHLLRLIGFGMQIYKIASLHLQHLQFDIPKYLNNISFTLPPLRIISFECNLRYLYSPLVTCAALILTVGSLMDVHCLGIC